MKKTHLLCNNGFITQNHASVMPFLDPPFSAMKVFLASVVINITYYYAISPLFREGRK